MDSAQQRKDTEHLRLLYIFHFIFGGLAVAGIGFLVVHGFIMQAVFTSAEVRNAKGGPPPEEFIHILIAVYAVLAFLFIAAGALNVFSGLSIKRRRRRTLSLVTAGLNCLSFPFGTALGVFTFVVLTRDSVRGLYETRDTPL